MWKKVLKKYSIAKFQINNYKPNKCLGCFSKEASFGRAATVGVLNCEGLQ